jgi:hypothetical protein
MTGWPDIFARPSGVHPAGARAWMAAISVAVFALSLTLGTWNNTFPYYYHLDEPLEVQMVINGTTNFHHPLLMGNTTDLARRLLGTSGLPQTIVEIGRTCIAVFAALACVAFAWVGYRLAGLAGGLATGVLVALNPLLVELSHYYKEDPALLLGMAVSFLMVTIFWDAPTRRNALLLGAANGLAFSGKYIGITVVALSLAVLIFARPRKLRVAEALLCTLGFSITVAVINYQLVAGAGKLFSGVSREVALLDAGGSAVQLTSKYLGVLNENAHLLLLLCAGWYLLRLILRPREHGLPEYLFVAFALGFALMLSLTPKTAERYFLPVTVLTCLFAGVGMADICRSLPIVARHAMAYRYAAFGILFVAAAGLFAATISKRLEGFGADTRRQLAAHIEKNLPLDAVLVQDSRVQLVAVLGKSKEQRAFSVPQRVLSNHYAGDFGSVQELREKNILYVALMVGQKYKPHPASPLKTREEYDAFIRDLKETGEVIWTGRPRAPQIVNPHLELYRLPPLETER